MKKFSIAIATISIMIAIVSFVTSVHAGTLNVGVADLTDGHSEGDGDRCINDGWAVDIGYDFVTWEYVPKWTNGWGGINFTPGALFTYSNYETAARERVGAPEYDQKRESALTLIGVAKPGIRIWRINAFLMLGAGLDWMEADDKIDVGALIEGHGVNVRITDHISLGINHRKFQRADNGHYSYNTAQVSWTF